MYNREIGTRSVRCPACHQPQRNLATEFPASTWLLTVEVADPGTGILPTSFSKVWYLGNYDWDLAYVSLQVPENVHQIGHHFSVHFVQGMPFFYDDLQRGGKLIRYHDGMFNPFWKVERAVYYRNTDSIIA
jgi:hypothetical protein